jgi:MerR family transcriptional regulator, light-induced transcriptional regulator
MNFFTIRDIENLTAIKAHTLRIWEQRYNLVTPKRKQGKHRTYDNEELKFLLRIAYLYHQGEKISRIAGMSDNEIRHRALDADTNPDHLAAYYNQLTEAAIDLDTDRFEQVFNKLISVYGFENTMLQIVYPLLKKMGNLWLTGHVIPTQEHFASAVITKKLLVAIDSLEFTERPGRKTVLVFTPKGEEHEIPILFAYYMLKKNGIPVLYAGKNITMEVLAAIAEMQKFDRMYFHLITNLTGTVPEQYLRKLLRDFPEKQIFCSGQSLNHSQSPDPAVHILKTPEELSRFFSGA